MTFRVALAGCTGYAGGELLRILVSHPQVEIGALTANSSAGTKLIQHHQHLAKQLGDRVVLPTSAETLAGHDVVFLALPHGTSAEIAAQLPETTLVIDSGADFRLRSASDWQKFYGTEHAGTWPYGLPELPGQREVLASAKRIAVPGCYPTTVTLGLAPALVAGVIDGKDVVVVAASGPSGAGKSLKPHLLGAELMGSCSAYGVGGSHRHVPEMLQNFKILGAKQPTISFTPVLAPMSRGILATITAPIAPETKLDEKTAREIFATYYAQEPSVTLLPQGYWPQSQSVIGSNQVHIQVTVDQAAGRLVVVATLDNLYKGTAGGAVQSMNLALGLPEFTGLNLIGVAP